VKLAWAALLLGLGCLTCAAPFRGGHAQPEWTMRDTKTLARFIPGHCEDRSHAEHSPRFGSVEVVETQTGRPLLLEHRQGHELLVAENVHDDGPFWVFELIVSGELLRRWRVPRGAGELGTLEVGRELTEVSRGEGFEAGLASRHLSCTLVPSAANLAGGSTNPSP